MRELLVDPRDATPMWSQIETQVRQLVASRRLLPGTMVPSVRTLAAQLVVNPATVAKAYQRLCDGGVLTVRRGEGTFVADGAPEMSRAERGRVLREAADRYVVAAHTLGASSEEAVAAVEAQLGRFARRAQGDRR